MSKKHYSLSISLILLGIIFQSQVILSSFQVKAQAVAPTLTKTSSGRIFFDNFNRTELGTQYDAQGVAKARWTLNNNRLRFVSNSVVGVAGLRHTTAWMSGEMVYDFVLNTNTNTAINPGIVAQKANNGNFSFNKGIGNVQVLRNTSLTSATVIDQPKSLALSQDHRVKFQFGSIQLNATKLWINEEQVGSGTAVAPTLADGTFMFQVISNAQNGMVEYDNVSVYRSTNLTVNGVTGSWALFANDGQTFIGTCNTAPIVDYATITSFPPNYAQGPAAQIKVFANTACSGAPIATHISTEQNLIFGGDVFNFDPGTPEPSPTPIPTPSPSPSIEPSPSPTPEPSSSPEPSPTPEVSPSPTPEPSPSPEPSIEPTPSPEPIVSPVPSPSPSTEPSPSPSPSIEPSPEPSPTPDTSPSPTPEPSPSPSATPEPSPSPAPSPTLEPSPSPTPSPTPRPIVKVLGTNTRQFTYGDQPYRIFGLGDCVDTDQDGDFTNNWYIGLPNQQKVDLQTYLDTYAAAGFNTIRLNNANCSPIAYSFSSTLPNPVTYNNAVRDDYRTMMQVIKNHPGNWKILYTFFGFQEIPQLNNTSTLNTESMANVCEAIEYAVESYGEYVDFWEILNEKDPKNNQWHSMALECARNADPLDRIITTSWEELRNPNYEYDDIHDYQQEGIYQSDNRVWQWRQNTMFTNRPAFFGEFGNAECNWDTEHAARLGIHAYMSIFSEMGMMWWNTSIHQRYCPTNSVAANAFIGPDERAKVKEATDFAATLPATAKVTAVTTTGAIDAYALTWPDNGGGGAVYVVADQAGIISNATVSVNVPGRGTQLIVVPDFETSYLYQIQ